MSTQELPYERRNYAGFLWHALLLAVTVTFTEINTILPAMIIRIGGSEFHIGIMTGIMVGVPLVSQLLFAGFLHSRPFKKPFLLAGINLRLAALALIAFTLLNIARFSLAAGIIIIYLELLLFTVSGAFAGISYVDIMGKSFTGDFRKKFFVRKQLIATIGILISAVIAREILKRVDYPDNYFILFISASAVLLLASGGFWILREKPAAAAPGTDSSPYQHRERIGKTLRSIPERLKTDSNLRNYIIISNLLGFSIVLLPFYVTLAKIRYELDPEVVGNLLLIQIAGMVVSNFVWSHLVKKRGFKGILYVFAVTAALLPAAALLVSGYLPIEIYYPVFAVSGMVLSAQKLTSDAVVVEITTDENRALYTGIIGTFNLSRALFPIIIGSILGFTGYTPIFAAIGLLAVISTLFIGKLNCPIDRISSEE